MKFTLDSFCSTVVVNPSRRWRSGVSGEALGLASYADVPVPPGREPSRARTMAGRSRRRRWPLHGRHGRHGP